jgi:hypothetical protein
MTKNTKQTAVFTILSTQLVRWFIKKVWPWIVKNIWPQIQDKLFEIFDKMIDHLFERLLASFAAQKKSQEDAARHKAESAEKKAQSTEDKNEAEKYRAIAAIWREVAESFRQENEALRDKLNSIAQTSASEFRENLSLLKLDDIVKEGDDGTIMVDGAQTTLQLPMPRSQ